MEEQNLAIDMDPEVYAAFKASTNVSGKSEYPFGITFVI